jgi:aspartate aminotransferase-like enzyme
MDDPMNYFATPAVNLVWAMIEATSIIKEEGLKERDARHAKHAKAFQKAILGLGFTLLAEEKCRAYTLSNIIYPSGIDDMEFRKALIEEGIIGAGGLGAYKGKMFRIGHMGNIDTNDLVATLSTIERVLARFGKLEKAGLGVGIYLDELAK